MGKVVTIDKLDETLQEIRQQNKKITLTGGCFDIVHLGHMIFLEKSKAEGDVLMLLLESDETIKRLKGENRPINSQINRARLLTYVRPVDYVVILPEMKTGADYDRLIEEIRPAVITTTEGDRILEIKKKQAERAGGELKVVTKLAEELSTSKIIDLIKYGRI